MTVFVALLRAVNVGGTGKLPMAELAALFASLGVREVKTYIQSGNVLFRSELSEAELREKAETAVASRLGKATPVMIRTAEELGGIVARNPFSDAPGNRVLVLFDHGAPSQSCLDGLKTPGGEQVRLGVRELYAYYPDGMGRSKLKLPAADRATARNLNTVSKLAALAAAL